MRFVFKPPPARKTIAIRAVCSTFTPRLADRTDPVVASILQHFFLDALTLLSYRVHAAQTTSPSGAGGARARHTRTPSSKRPSLHQSVVRMHEVGKHGGTAPSARNDSPRLFAGSLPTDTDETKPWSTKAQPSCLGLLVFCLSCLVVFAGTRYEHAL